MRWLAVLICFVVACKKKDPEPEPEPTKPSSGSSVTKIEENADPQTGSTTAKLTGSKPATGPVDAGGEATGDARVYGGDGTPARFDDKGHAQGPGGRVVGGRGPDCTEALNHCLRDSAWFATTSEMKPGKIYRAIPVFELEGKWYTWIGREESVTTAYKTKVATKADLQPGKPIMWLVKQPSQAKWVNSEYEALTSSRWEVGVIERVNGDMFTIEGWRGEIDVNTARVLTERRDG